MGGYEVPQDLLRLRREFLAFELRQSELSRCRPAPSATLSDEQQAEWVEAYSECVRLAEEIHRHPYWATVDSPHRAWMALQAAAEEPATTAG
ncbi:hypothetical protein [Nonomuraea longicatena]|uniref:Uncharacterized protein n=1 Tax=Nonomuraea longicatena TaxID=83682 RepID=A0ABN1NMF7_9ACTN